MSREPRLALTVCGLSFRNPIVLAAGTAGYGRELDGMVDLSRLGGLATKAISLEPRQGAPEPRVTDFAGGMLNAVGLANPGLRAVVDAYLPWLATHHPGTRKIANIVGFTIEEFADVITGVETAVAPGALAAGAIEAYELNVSCPNVRAGGMEFGSDPDCLHEVVARARAATRRPLFVKLSPALPNLVHAAQVAAIAGADGITLVNTLPGLLIDVERRRPVLGFGTGGISGPALLPVGVLATWKVSCAVSLPIIGVGGVRVAADALQYLLAGASLVGMGTAALRDPRQPERLARELETWCERHDVATIASLVGTMKWPM
ncbi:MAG TPA: dihydroorotate dehydrogenase [Gemmatimonadaceae bacterium]|nr:dihydroorotate dehydrogenase [Gemmatimonadaceae bacterium]